jgi:microcystin-dependent protein
MSYSVRFTEITNPSKPAIVVADQTLNNQTSVTLIGKNYKGFAPVLAENFLHLLENFASPTDNPPANPVQGQLWYDNTQNFLNVYDGTSWSAAGSLKKSGVTPESISSSKGDLWVDTNNSQLYLYSGSNWLLVGPQYSAGKQTGPIVEAIVDTSNVSHSVISFYGATSSITDSNNYRVGIISKDTFTPKSIISGFPVIQQGFNLSLTDSDSVTSPSKIWGTSEKAEALVVNGVTVLASNFLRGDISSTSISALNIRANAGLSIGSDLSFNIGVDGASTIFYSKNDGDAIDFKLKYNSITKTVMHIDATTRIGIGTNNAVPLATLDVAGSIFIKDDIVKPELGRLIVAGTADTTDVGGASIQTLGGLKVVKKSTFTDDIRLTGKLYLTTTTGSSAILPTTNLQYDIGDTNYRFRNVYAQAFVGAFSGSFSGILDGSVTGSAGRLATPTTFRLQGQLDSDSQSFDGQTSNGLLTLTTTLNETAISSQTITTAPAAGDYFLLQRPGAGLLKVSKASLQSNMPTMPVGAIIPFAGTAAPAGYLLCDGAEVSKTTYQALYAVIQDTYLRDTTLEPLVGYGTFRLPDLRGRFALGKDSMNNGILVPSASNSAQNVQTVTGPANRVTDVTADNVGTGAGHDTAILLVKNLPDHQHTLSSSQTPYYSMPGSQAVASASTDGAAFQPIQVSTSTSTAYGNPKTGSITGTTQTGQAVDIMNPYLTINYIIFTGNLQ